MKLNGVWLRARTVATTVVLFVATNAHAAAVAVRDEDGWGAIVKRVVRTLMKICGDTLTSPGG